MRVQNQMREKSPTTNRKHWAFFCRITPGTQKLKNNRTEHLCLKKLTTEP